MNTDFNNEKAIIGLNPNTSRRSGNSGGAIDKVMAGLSGAANIAQTTAELSKTDTNKIDSNIQDQISFNTNALSNDQLMSDWSSYNPLDTISYKDIGKNGKQIAGGIIDGTMQGASAGTSIMPGWGTLIGALAGATSSGIGAIAGRAKARRQAREYNNKIADANMLAYNRLNDRASDISQIQSRNQMKNFYAEGGSLSNSNNSDYINNIREVNNGGTHEENPNDGVPVSIGNDGFVKKVEEGEIIYNDFVYSNRLKPSEEFKKKYDLKGDTYADCAKYAMKEFEDRPNDEISKRGLERIMSIIADNQEAQKEESKQAQIDNQPTEEIPIEEQSIEEQQIDEPQYQEGNMPMEDDVISQDENLYPYGGRIEPDFKKFLHRYRVDLDNNYGLMKEPFVTPAQNLNMDNPWIDPYVKNTSEDLAFDIMPSFGDPMNETYKYTPSDLPDRQMYLDEPESTTGKPLDLSGVKPRKISSNTDGLDDNDPEKYAQSHGNNSYLMRYAGTANSISNVLKDAVGLQNKPDYSHYTPLERRLRSIPHVGQAHNGNYAKYRQEDYRKALNEAANLLQAQRAIGQYTNGDYARMAAMDKMLNRSAAENTAKIYSQLEANELADRRAVDTYNYGINKDNSTIDMSVQEKNRDIDMNIASKLYDIAQQKQAIQTAAEASRSVNQQQMVQNIQNIGNERFAMNMTSNNPWYKYNTDGTISFSPAFYKLSVEEQAKVLSDRDKTNSYIYGRTRR